MGYRGGDQDQFQHLDPDANHTHCQQPIIPSAVYQPQQNQISQIQNKNVQFAQPIQHIQSYNDQQPHPHNLAQPGARNSPFVPYIRPDTQDNNILQTQNTSHIQHQGILYCTSFHYNHISSFCTPLLHAHQHLHTHSTLPSYSHFSGCLTCRGMVYILSCVLIFFPVNIMLCLFQLMQNLCVVEIWFSFIQFVLSF